MHNNQMSPFQKSFYKKTSECGTICSDQRFVALHFVTIAFVKLRQIGTVISHDMVDSIAWKILIWIVSRQTLKLYSALHIIYHSVIITHKENHAINNKKNTDTKTHI